MNTQTLAIIAIAAVVGLVFAATIVQAVDARRQSATQVAIAGREGQAQNVLSQQQGRHNSAVVVGIQNHEDD
jgi:uncharacterized membrane protein